MDRLVVQKDIYTTRWCKSHISADDDEFIEALNDQNINTELYTQAANSLRRLGILSNLSTWVLWSLY